jgi:hypothetical protein
MSNKTKAPAYFYRPMGYEEAEQSGVMMYRDSSMPEDVWHALPHAIDRLIGHLMSVTGDKTIGLFLDAIGIESASVTRVRQGKQDIPEKWLVWMSSYSGLGLRALYEISGLEPSIPRFDAHRYT